MHALSSQSTGMRLCLAWKVDAHRRIAAHFGFAGSFHEWLRKASTAPRRDLTVEAESSQRAALSSKSVSQSEPKPIPRNDPLAILRVFAGPYLPMSAATPAASECSPRSANAFTHTWQRWRFFGLRKKK